MRIFARFIALPIQDVTFLILSIALLTFSKIGLRLFSLRTLLFFSERVFLRFGGPVPKTQQNTARVAWAVSTVARRVPALANCLAMALAGKYLLAMLGCPSVLEIGVTKDCAQFKAHAWLKTDGKILIGSAERSEYSALPCFDGENK